MDAALAADFAALGFCRLQIELLTRHMRYSLHVDETLFREQTIAAAIAAVAGDSDAARGHLQQCFDVLNECRKHFYPVDAYLIDVTLLAESTLGASLMCELQVSSPKNLLTPASLLTTLATQHPDAWSQLLAAIDRGELCVLGNEVDESPLPLMPLESALASLAAGAGEFDGRLGRRPRVYARRSFGLWPTLPQLLTKLGYQGALHFTLDDGRFPLGPQCKSRWQGLDSSGRSTSWPASLATLRSRRACSAIRARWPTRWTRTTSPRWSLHIGPARLAPGTTICPGGPLEPGAGQIRVGRRILQQHRHAGPHFTIHA